MDSNKNNNYLSHHGIKGQKWGLRRYQNPDGSLTEEGRRRRGFSDKKEGPSLKKLVKKAQEKSDTKKVKAAVMAHEKKVQKKSDEKNAKTEAKKHEELKKYVREHPSKLYKHRTEFSREELNKLIDDINFDRRLKDIQSQETRRTLDKVRNVANNLNTIRNFAETSKGIYNLAAEINNTLVDTGMMNGRKWPKIGEKSASGYSKEFEKLLNAGNWSEILNRQSEFTLSELMDANKRKAVLKGLSSF